MMIRWFFRATFLTFLLPCTSMWTTSANHTIVFLSNTNNATTFRLKGINWFGYEGGCNIVGGLQYHDMDFYLDQLQELQYNALRIPFGYETVLNWEQPPLSSCLSPPNEALFGNMSVRDTMHVLFQKAADRHMVILLDFHTIAYEVTQYPWTGDITRDLIMDTWKQVIWEFSPYENLLGVDVKNEPHGNITWDVWGAFLLTFVDTVTRECPHFNGLIFVGGIQESLSVWGGGFTSMGRTLNPILPRPSLVFSPHIYGYSIRGQVALEDTYMLLDHWFGFLLRRFPNPVVVGEIGGWAVNQDRQWHTLLQHYLVRRNITDVFYWCLNPDSHDTGGLLLDDWTTMDAFKVAFHRRIQPRPTTDLVFAAPASAPPS
ncbi:hypothetical protein EBZ80_14750 [bacterium]|nr:hypothetical protein [bacterium]